MDLTATIPVGVAVALIQVVKVFDKTDSLKAYYSLISLAIGLVCGVLYGVVQGHEGVALLAWDGVQNAAGTALAWVVKESTLGVAGVKLPGDSGTGAQPDGGAK